MPQPFPETHPAEWKPGLIGKPGHRHEGDLMPRISLKSRIAGTLAVAAVALGTLGVGAAHAATTPGIAYDGIQNVLAVQTPNHSLKIYYQAGGVWQNQTIAGPGTTYSAPSVTRHGISVAIAAEGPHHTLRYYVQAGPLWHEQTVAGASSTFSAPSIAQYGGGEVIAAEGPLSTLRYYYQAGATWHGQTVAGVLSTFSAPSVTQFGAQVAVAAEGLNRSLRVYTRVGNTGSWSAQSAAGGGTTFSAPSITASGGVLFATAQGPGGSLKYYQRGAVPLWHKLTIAAGGTTSAPSIAVNTSALPNRIYIAVQGTSHRLLAFRANITNLAFTQQVVAFINSTYSAPSVVAPGDNLIAAAGPGNSLWLWRQNGINPWLGLQVAPAGSVG